MKCMDCGKIGLADARAVGAHRARAHGYRPTKNGNGHAKASGNGIRMMVPCDPASRAEAMRFLMGRADALEAEARAIRGVMKAL